MGINSNAHSVRWFWPRCTILIYLGENMKSLRIYFCFMLLPIESCTHYHQNNSAPILRIPTNCILCFCYDWLFVRLSVIEVIIGSLNRLVKNKKKITLYFSLKTKWAWWCMPVIPLLGRLKHKLEAHLGYIMSSRSAWISTTRACLWETKNEKQQHQEQQKWRLMSSRPIEHLGTFFTDLVSKMVCVRSWIQ